MASNVTKTPLFRAISKRHYAAAAKLAQACNEVQVKVLPNKMVVAATESALPVSRVSILFRAGSRFETPELLGASSVLRSSGSLSTRGATNFGIVRNLQQIGASLSVTSDRECISYTLEATPDKIEQGLQYLCDAATKQVFKPWELDDQVPRLLYQLATIPPQARVLDLVNNAAYRSGLGNSIFVKEHNIKKLNTEAMQYFVRETITAQRGALAGVGVSCDHLAQLATSLELGSSAGDSTPAKYHGGEVRAEAHLPHVYIALAAEAAGLKTKEALIFSVLRYAMGSSPAVKYGLGSGPVGKLIADSKEPLGVTAFSSAYSDSGLFGFVLATTPKNAQTAVSGVSTLLSKASVSDADVARGKALLKAQLITAAESGASVCEDIGHQAIMLGSVLAAPQIAAAVDSVTTAQVQDVARKVASGKKSMASYGNITYTPYLDQVAK